MKFILLLVSILFAAIGNAQPIPDFKADEECLTFIQSKIKGMKDFYFDTLFSEVECRKLTPKFKFWRKIDLNEDKKPDLIFVGAFAKSNYQPYTAMIYLSNGNSYNLIPIVRQGRTSFRPHVFTQKQKNQTLLIVHNYYFSDFQKVETLLKTSELSRETCAGDDTVMFKFGSILDFSSRPSNIIFDSLVIVKKYGWSCNVDSFVIFKNGNGRYYGGCGFQNPIEKKFQESISNINYLKYLVQTIDLNRIQRSSVYGGTDNNSATVRIYHDNTVEIFFDYGLEASFTLKAIYKYVEELQQEL